MIESENGLGSEDKTSPQKIESSEELAAIINGGCVSPEEQIQIYVQFLIDLHKKKEDYLNVIKFFSELRGRTLQQIGFFPN